MTRAAIRAAAWVIMLASGAAFLFAVRGLAPGPIAPRTLAFTCLPHQIACAALLALFWVGPFPESWPWLGAAWTRRTPFWTLVVMLGGFWLFFYAKFIFRLV